MHAVGFHSSSSFCFLCRLLMGSQRNNNHIATEVIGKENEKKKRHREKLHRVGNLKQLKTLQNKMTLF